MMRSSAMAEKSFTRVSLRMFMPTFRSMALVAASFFSGNNAIAGGLAAHADQSAFGGGYLNARVNGIQECHIAGPPGNPHIVATIRRPHVGNALRFQRFDLEIYDYIFGASHTVQGGWITEQAKLEKPGVIDIALVSATALVGDPQPRTRRKASRIFGRHGTYLLLLGYAFDSSDEPEIGGVCQIEYRSP